MKPHSSPPFLQKKTHKNRCSYLTALFIVAFLLVLYGEDFWSSLKPQQHRQQQPLDHASRDQQQQPLGHVPREQQKQPLSHVPPEKRQLQPRAHVPREQQRPPVSGKQKLLPFAVGKAAADCGVFDGKWVYDEASRPQYEEKECPYIQAQLTCQEHGRPDRGYQHWRWQPHRCSLPSFNATFMLEKIRGKRLLFVGDSLNRGQFVSMVCLLHQVLPESSKSMETFDSLTVFTAKDYNATVEFYWAPFLVESNSDNAIKHRIKDRIVRAGSVEKHAKHWEGADIFVFNTYLWWMSGEKMKILKGSFSDEVKDISLMETEDAFRMALKSMIKWVEEHTDPSKNRIFFTSMSPSHTDSKLWGGEPYGNCYNQTMPIEDPNYWGSSSKAIMQVLGEEFRQAKIPIQLINITQLSEYRKDAHTQIYKKQWSPLSPEQLAKPTSYADCIHWCLPGLQDTWNELLYAKLFFP